MRVLALRRVTMAPDGTLGVILDETGHRIVDTLELPDLGNKPRMSCIPAGTYTARRRFSPKHGIEVFQLEGVPNREDIELHVGNYSSGPDVSTEGCILLGLGFTMQTDGSPMLMASKTGFALFMKQMEGVDSFTLAITNPVPLAA